ncbi:YceI family protein [Aquisalinus flavus]|uniref:Polyisoprenoid-binding protein n=1 Tax=Aquisalinus flavus TaxID=1526572 RepID=A0A8J2V300_9PROT|nr:YceI family protein [Aquisalinus flavus]MBD0425357.1 YceI family protein [Aquisalinus flavus]UNE48993.1 YceI family protein [Aquisalinus flavus]GGD16741.1 polyisoprenoid-binding protein [Aquisalinus flavus]
MRRIAALAGLFIVTGAFASPVLNLDGLSPDATLFRLNQAESDLAFEVRKMGFMSEKGRFADVTATIYSDSPSLETIRMATVIDVDSIVLSSEDKRQWLLGEDWFNAATYPEATFECADVTMTGPREAVAEGMMTIRGISQPATFAITFDSNVIDSLRDDEVLSFEATGSFSRSAFGMTKMSGLLGDIVELDFDGRFDRASVSRAAPTEIPG